MLEKLRTLLMTSLLLLGSGNAYADDPAAYPTRPIRVIVPFAPGGATDVTLRMIQNNLSQALGQPIIVDNRAGAAGNIGMEVAAKAAPDGYTLFLGNVGTVSINPNFYPDLGVVPERDFLPISLASETPGILVASPKFPASTVKEAIAYIKANPGKVNYAAAGISTLNTLEMELMKQSAGLDMTQVPYKGGAGPALADLLSSHVDIMFVTLSSASGFVKGKQLKALAVSTQDRLPQLPDVPTLAEQGYGEMTSSSWQGLFAVAGTPQPIVQRLHKALVEAMSDAKTRQLMIDAGNLPSVSETPEAFGMFIAGEQARWKKTFVALGAQPEKTPSK